MEILAETKEKTKYEIDLYAYCLMGNHVHLLIKENNMELGDFMRRATAQYALWRNYKYERKGHVFQDRFKSEPVEDEGYLLTVFRYILQNPLKAELSKGVFDYKWSSWKSYEHNHEYPVRLTDVTYIMNIFGKTRKEAIQGMKRFVQKQNNDNCLDIDTGVRLTDDELRDQIKREFPEIEYQSLKQLSREERNQALRKIKSIEGAAKLQIARITGLGAKIVQNA